MFIATVIFIYCLERKGSKTKHSTLRDFYRRQSMKNSWHKLFNWLGMHNVKIKVIALCNYVDDLITLHNLLGISIYLTTSLRSQVSLHNIRNVKFKFEVLKTLIASRKVAWRKRSKYFPAFCKHKKEKLCNCFSMIHFEKFCPMVGGILFGSYTTI